MIPYMLVGAAAGVISGMGIGGGTVLIPALVMLFGVSQHQAQTINLLFFIPTAIIALWVHIKNKNIEKRLWPKLVLYGVITALLGSMIATRMDATLLKRLFGGFLLVMGVLEFFKKGD